MNVVVVVVVVGVMVVLVVYNWINNNVVPGNEDHR